MKENVEKTSLFFNWIWQLKLGALRVKLYLSLSCHHKYSTVDGFNNRKNRTEFFTLWVDKHIQTNTNKVQQNSSKNTKLKKKTLKKSSKTRDQTKDDFDTLHNVSNRSTWTNEKSSIQKKSTLSSSNKPWDSITESMRFLCLEIWSVYQILGETLKSPFLFWWTGIIWS